MDDILENSFVINNISSKQLKEILPSIVNPVTHIFNLSFQTGYIPLELKTARVVPVHRVVPLQFTRIRF